MPFSHQLPIQDIKVKLLLTGGHQYTLTLKSDAPLLHDLFRAIAARSQKAVFSCFFQIPIDRGRAALCFPSEHLMCITTEPPLSWQPDALDNVDFGNILPQQDQLQAALLQCQKALTLNPNNADLHNKLGFILGEQGKLEEAIAHFRQAIALNPHHLEAYCNWAGTVCFQGKYHQSIELYQKAIQLKPDYAEAHAHLAIVLLLIGDLRRGFAEYEWRWRYKTMMPRSLPQPLWDGSHLAGKTILLYAEQGFGDTVQFIRYVSLVNQCGGRVVVECQAPLRRLLATVSGIEQLVVLGETLPQFQVQAPLMSLPHILGTTLETIPAQIPYLTAPTADRLRLEPLPGTKLKVGLVWASGYKKDSVAFRNYQLSKSYQLRSCPVSLYTKILSIPEISFFSLQVGEDAAAIAQLLGKHQLQDLSPHVQNFADTAALIVQMDLVITVDTAVAHLAGALGKPVWVLLSFHHDWRWLLEREDSPWYPTMRLFRQLQPGDWQEVIERVAQTLSSFDVGVIPNPGLIGSRSSSS